MAGVLVASLELEFHTFVERSEDAQETVLKTYEVSMSIARLRSELIQKKQADLLHPSGTSEGSLILNNPSLVPRIAYAYD